MQRLVGFALKSPLLIVALTCGLIAVGLRSWMVLDVEAYPNPVAPMIEIITQPQGLSAEEVERYVTVPLENALVGMPDLVHLRSQSLFGLSDVKCYFDWTPSYTEAQQRVINRLQFAQLPAGMQPQLSPWNAVGEIYRYVLRGKGHTLSELKTAQDWILEKQFKQVPGVIDVTGFGGETRQIQVDVDPLKLRGHGLTLPQLTAALSNSNQSVGGQRLSLGEQSYDVRAVGLIQSLDDVRQTVLTAPKGTPVSVRDVAIVHEGAAPRLGVVGRDAEADVVQGIVLMRYGGDALQTLAGVRKKLDDIRRLHLLPPGMEIETTYDRGTLVKLTTATVVENLLVGMALVALVLWLFLGETKAALLSAVNVPLSLLAAFAGMVLTGTPANLISLGAVDFGIIVDSTVIVVENVYRHLGAHGAGTLRARIVAAVGEIASPMSFSTLVILVAFIPLFTMTGVSGVIFSPLARTYAISIAAALVLALTLTPVLASRLLGVRHAKPRPQPEPIAEDPEARADQLLRNAHLAATRKERRAAERAIAEQTSAEEHDHWLMRALRRFYDPLFVFATRRPWLALSLAGLPVIAAGALASQLGGEFMPHLEEGNFWIRATLPVSVAAEPSARYAGRMRRILLGCPADERVACDLAHRTRPEITTVISQVGRPDDGTDVSGFSNIELLAPLKPTDEWRRGITKESMTEELSKELSDAFPGIGFNFSQAIADNVEEAMSGVKGENTIKVAGPDLEVNERKAEEIVRALSTVRGVTDLGLESSLGQPDVRISPDRALCRRFGLNVGDVAAIVQAAVGGAVVTQVYEGEKRFDLVVRWAPDFRRDLRALREIGVPTPDGAQIPLGQVASIESVMGPARVFREDGSRFAPVKFSVRGRDLASTIEEAKARVAEQVQLPWDTHLEWGGEINELREATDRLFYIVPLTLLLIAFLVYSAVQGLRDTCVVLAGIPVACSGGLIALSLTGTHLSISPAMGFVSIFGIAVQDALLVVTATQRLWREGYGLVDGARLGAERGLRPVLMTAAVALIGLLPAALSHGIGSETQKPLAIVVIGGALALSLLPRLLQPALMVLVHRRDSPQELAGRARGPREPAHEGAIQSA
ncbi:MAG: efflux RND transporter permease subunit [Deltaproteobacteria bacterium]|nr:efflux RND transporter permease subunit [Deltaproteobacteria bacterium]